MTTTDLSGRWDGRYSYADGRPDVAFAAVLQDGGGAFTGTIEEVDAWEGPLQASVDGRRDGSRVSFVKFYDTGSAERFDTVAYEGTLSADNLEIDGVWRLPGGFSGRFLMIRAGGVEAEAERRESVRV